MIFSKSLNLSAVNFSNTKVLRSLATQMASHSNSGPCYSTYYSAITCSGTLYTCSILFHKLLLTHLCMKTSREQYIIYYHAYIITCTCYRHLSCIGLKGQYKTGVAIYRRILRLRPPLCMLGLGKSGEGGGAYTRDPYISVWWPLLTVESHVGTRSLYFLWLVSKTQEKRQSKA